jgi:hypothetical protein
MENGKRADKIEIGKWKIENGKRWRGLVIDCWLRDF